MAVVIGRKQASKVAVKQIAASACGPPDRLLAASHAWNEISVHKLDREDGGAGCGEEADGYQERDDQHDDKTYGDQLIGTRQSLGEWAKGRAPGRGLAQKKRLQPSRHR